MTLWTIAPQAPLSTGFCRHEYWSGLPCPLLRDLAHPGIRSVSLGSPALAGRFFITGATSVLWNTEVFNFEEVEFSYFLLSPAFSVTDKSLLNPVFESFSPKFISASFIVWSFPSTICWKGSHFPSAWSRPPCWRSLTIHMRVYVWAVCSVLLACVCLSASTTVL